MHQHMLAFGDISIDGILRDLWATLCQLIYRLIAWLYEMFINIAQVDFLSQDSIKEVYKRVTMIFTIIMVFYITFELVKYVVQPDAMTDKEQGAGNIVKKIMIVIVLIAFTPDIFSAAYKVQNTLLKNQVISKVILGKQNVQMSTYGRAFASNMLGMFYYVDENVWKDDKKCDGISCKTVVNINLSSLNERGTLEFLHHGLNDGEKVKTTDEAKKSFRYFITFDGLLAVIVGGVIAYILVLYCVDAGTRVGQLAFLQIIAPIPIIGYLSPKKDGIFQKWYKQCLATYLDLFIRLTVIYLVLMLCDLLGKAYHDGTLFNNIPDVSQTTKVFMYIFIVMGLLLLGQRVPKMLKELFPSMSAASGNLGLKAGERVAPMAARAIGAGLGLSSNLVRGGIRRAAWRRARNKANGWATGWEALTKEGREKNRQKREEERQHRLEARNARSRNRAYKKDEKNKEQFDDARNAYNELQEKETGEARRNLNAAIDRKKKATTQAERDAADADIKKYSAELRQKNESLMKSKEHQNYVDKAKPILGQTQVGRERERAVTAAQSKVDAAQRKLDRATASGDTVGILAAQTELTNAQQELKIAQNPTKAARDEITRAQAELTAAEASGDDAKISAAKEKLAQAQQEYRKVAPVTVAYENVKDAQAALAAAEASGDQAKINSAKASLDKAQQEYQKAQANNQIVGGSATVQANRRIVSNAEREVARAQEIVNTANRFGTEEDKRVANERLAQAQKNLADAKKQSKDNISSLLNGDKNELAQQYEQAQTKANEQVLEDRNKAHQGLGGSVLSTLASGVRGATTGAHATKLEDIGKQVSKANKDDIANVKAVQKYYDDGGTGWVDRTIQQVEKNIGMPTAYERTQLGIHSYEPQIKTLEAQAGLTKDVKSTADAAEDRLKDKIEDLSMVVGAGETIDAGSGDRVPERDSNGNIQFNPDGSIKWKKDADGNDIIINDTIKGDGTQTIAQMYRGVKARASQAKSEAEEAAKRKADLERQGKQNTPEYKQAKAESEYLNMVAANAEYAVTQFQKNGARHEFTQILKQFATSNDKEKTLRDLQTGDNAKIYDGVAVEKVYSTLRSLDVARSNPKVVEDMRRILGAGDFEAFMSGNITGFKMLDHIKVAAINAGNAYERNVKDIKEKQRSVQTSNETGAQKAANDFNGNNGGGK